MKICKIKQLSSLLSKSPSSIDTVTRQTSVKTIDNRKKSFSEKKRIFLLTTPCSRIEVLATKNKKVQLKKLRKQRSCTEVDPKYVLLDKQVDKITKNDNTTTRQERRER